MKHLYTWRTRLGGSLLAALLMAGTGSAAGVWSYRAADSSHAEKMRALAELERLEIRTVQPPVAGDLPALLGTHATLHARGITPAPVERRLAEWEQLLEEITSELGLENARYEFSPAHRADPASGDAALLTHHLGLHLELAHEEELLRLLDKLRSHAPAIVFLKGCRLTRLPEPHPGLGSARAHLQAECRSEWVTLAEERPDA